MPAQGRQVVFATGEWEIDLDRRELRTHGAPVPLGGRAFEIIEVLINSVGELVTKDELLSRVWPGATVEENTLQVHISALRKALGPDRGMLKTISGRGYRLLGTWGTRAPSPAPKGPLQPIVSGQIFQTNLPEPTSALIGRDAVRQYLHDLLSAYRIVTLTGPGGIGKTRLALEVARNLFPGFGGDCFLVELSSLSDPTLLPSAVARVLGLRLGEDAASQTVAQLVGGKKLLFVLDNCEHLIEAAAQFAETFVRLCAQVSILATSREVLRIDGEYVYRVPPLDVPSEDQADPEKVLQHSAAKLFVSRAIASQASWPPDRENLAAVSAICRRLDGIPLAIEFAAASAATLGLRHVAARLDDRFGLLTSGRRTALPRHQTLRAALDWSYELLTEQEQQVLRRLAVFHGGFTLEAAAAVVSDVANTLPAIEDIVGKLATKSLVQLDGSGPAVRWRLLETIRAYALEKLDEAGEAANARLRHAVYFRDMFAPMTAESCSDKPDSIAYDVRDLDNIRGALDWCFSPAGDLAIGVSLTAACVPLWLNLSLVAECRERAEQALAHQEIEQALSTRLRMQLYIAFGRAFVQSMGASEEIRSILSKGLEIATSINDADAELRALWAMWCHLDHKGEHAEARLFAQRFTQTARKKGDSADVFVGERLLGYTAHYLGDQVEARHHLERVVEGYIAPGGQRHMIWFQHDQQVVAKVLLARVLCLQGFLDQAMHLARESLEQAQASGQTLTLRYVLGWGICPLSLMTGDLEIGEESVAMLLDLAVRRGLPFWQTVGRALEATHAIRRGDFASGSAWLRGVLDARPGWILRFPDFLGAFAEGLAGSGQLAEALDTVERPLASAELGKSCWYLPEMLRIKADILFHLGVHDAEAEAGFREAINVARHQGALLWELRSATGLARMLRRDRSKEARQILAPVYGQFAEGFEAADLRAARAVLDTLR